MPPARVPPGARRAAAQLPPSSLPLGVPLLAARARRLLPAIGLPPAACPACRRRLPLGTCDTNRADVSRPPAPPMALARRSRRRTACSQINSSQPGAWRVRPRQANTPGWSSPGYRALECALYPVAAQPGVLSCRASETQVSPRSWHHAGERARVQSKSAPLAPARSGWARRVTRHRSAGTKARWRARNAGAHGLGAAGAAHSAQAGPLPLPSRQQPVQQDLLYITY